MSAIEQALNSAIEAMNSVSAAHGGDTFVDWSKLIFATKKCKSTLSELEKCEPVYQAREINDYMWRDCNIGWFREYLKQPEYAARVLYTSPISKEWVGLSQEDRASIIYSEEVNLWNVAKSIEAKLKQLNTKG